MTTREAVAAIVDRVPGVDLIEFVSTSPTPTELWTLVALHDTRPLFVADELSECRERWRLLCTSLDLVQGMQDVLLSIGGLGGAPWAKVRCSSYSVLLDHDLPLPEEPEFVLLSTDGTRLAAVTTEEHGYYLFGGRLTSAGSVGWLLEELDRALTANLELRS